MPPILPSALLSDDDSEYGSDYYYGEYEDDDADYDHRLSVPGGGSSSRSSSSRIDDLGRDSAAQHGKLAQRSSRPGWPFAADSSAGPPASNSPIPDDGGISGRPRSGISSSSDAIVDPLYIGLTVTIACLLLAVGVVLIVLIALRTCRRDGGSFDEPDQ